MRRAAELTAPPPATATPGVPPPARSDWATLARLLVAERVQASFQKDSALSTTVKLRVIGRQQQLLRIDFENTPDHEVLRAKLADFSARLADCDVVILSDYGKGGLTHITEMIQRAKDAGKPVLVDPKGDDYARYAGATLLTPNRAELREVTGKWHNEAELVAKAQQLLSARAATVPPGAGTP